MDEVSIIVGARPPAGLTMYQLVAAIVAATIGLASIAVTIFFGIKNRNRSIDDDFWFRKVVAPFVIDNAMNFSAKWSERISKANEIRGNAKKTRSEVDDCKIESGQILINCLCLKLYDKNRYIQATNKVDAIVDSVTECFYAASSSAISNEEVTKIINSKRNEIGEALLALLSELKNMQAKF